MSNNFDEERKERKDQWRAEKIAQYKTYKYPSLRATVSRYYDDQAGRLAFENRNRENEETRVLAPETIEASKVLDKAMKKWEATLTKQITKEIADIPIYKEYLSKVRGLGPVLSGCLIAYIQDISRFDTISKLHRYAGLSAIDGKAQKPSFGRRIDYNPRLKTVMFKIGESFMKAKNVEYRAEYDKAHRHYEERGEWSEENPTGNKNKKHLQFRSMKKMERIFLANVWLKWRELEGLPVSDPWVFAIGGHDSSHMKIIAY